MAQYNFEGDIDNLTESQLQFFRDIIKDQGLENSKVVFEPVGKAGDNYVANVKKITAEGENGTLKLFAKIAPTEEIIWEGENTCLYFQNEHVMYTEVLPKFVQLQKDAGVPEEDQFKYAKCYGSYTEKLKEIMVFEDLKALNYIMMDRFEPLPKDCIKSVLKNLAVLHSLSYVCREKDPEAYNNYKSKLHDVRSLIDGPTGEQMRVYLQLTEDDTLAILEDPALVDIVKGKISSSLSDAAKLAKADVDNQYNVIIQGDAWTNNLMFKFEDGKPPTSIMVDYQLSKSCCPMFDLMYMIFNGSDHETRKHHYYDWIDYYHSEVGKSLAYFDLDVNTIYPRIVLDEDLKRYGKILFGSCVAVVNLLVRKSEDVAKGMETLQRDDLTVAEQAQEFSLLVSDDETKKLFKNRVIGLIDSFTMFGLL
ncbi:uncharacterized protein LOC142980465 [Anticarsia gemmatalis]|uniref:uncharacterized protein LOC142980465 n=1 Tax=Anticarsia gemmatalis TaxID=129554 RepID=UPI003F76E2E9